MIKFLYISVFVVVFFVSMAFHIPSAWVIAQFSLPPNVSLSAISGTLWQGKANMLQLDKYQLGQVHWEFKPLKILLARLEYDVEFGKDSQIQLQGKGDFGVGLGGFYAKDVLASIPAIQAASLIPMTQSWPVEVAGQLELTLSEFDYAYPWCHQAKGQLVWVNPKIETPLALLHPNLVESQFSCEDSKIEMNGKQTSDEFTSAFDATLTADNHPNQGLYQLESWFKPGAKFPQNLNNQLSWLGSPDNQGRYPFQSSGRF